jgi:hypothetical protein
MLKTGRHQMQNAKNAECKQCRNANNAECIRASLPSCILGIDALPLLDFAV